MELFYILVYKLCLPGVSSSLGSKTVRTTDRVFLVALLIIYSVHFIVLMYALVCAVINFYVMPALLTFHLSVS